MKNDQPKQISTFPKPQWRIWLWGVLLFLVIFMLIKEVSKLSEKSSAEETMSFAKVDALPFFPAGEKAFGNYLQQNIRTDGTVKGRVIVAFVVEKTGKLINIRILRGISTAADDEVVRVLEKSPRWIPGRKDGKAVSVAYTMPVNFN